MTGQGHQIFADELTRFAQQAADQRIEALAERTAAPLRVAVRGRRGVGRGMVARALDRAGVRVTPPGVAADLLVQVIAEVAKPEDIRGPRPALALLNKADVTGLAGDGRVGSQCAGLAARMGVPVLPISGLLAVAALDDGEAQCWVDAQCWAGLRALAAHPDGSTCLDRSFDGFLTAPLPVPVATRVRLLRTLDLLGVALGVAALRQGAGPAQVRTVWRRASGVDAVIERLAVAGAQVRYRRVREAVTELEALAVSDSAVAQFLSRDDTVIARMVAALDAAAADGRGPGPDAPLARAVHWQRHGRTPLTELQRACAADITRGSLRLFSRAGGAGFRVSR